MPWDKGGGHPDSEIRRGGGGGLKNNFFRPFGPQFSLKLTGWADLRAPPPDLPLVCILYNCFCTFQPFYHTIK